MKSKRQPTAFTLLLLITAILLFSGCENGANADKVITDQEQMAAEFAAVNTAITRFNELKSGSIVSVYTGTFMPGSKVTMDEMSFERTSNGIKYSIIETYVEGDPFVVEEIAEDGVLPDFAYIYYPNKQLQVESVLDTAEKMTVSKNDKATLYRIDYSKNPNMLPENIRLGEAYSEYAIDKNDYLVGITNYRILYEQVPGNDKWNEIEEYYYVNLTKYIE